MDFETGHCCAHRNENTASSQLQLHDTAPGGYTAVHYGWGRGCHTNRSTGVCILLEKRFQPRMIKEISFSPASLAGRGGAIRLKGGTMDLGILASCSPPLSGCSGARRKVQLTASRQLLDWMRIRLSSWRRAESSRWQLEDLILGVGRFRDGTYADGQSVGDSHLAAQNEAGDNFVEMAMSLKLGILNTMWRTGGPTCRGLAGHRSTIDCELVPLSGLCCVQKVVTCWKLGRKLQLTAAAHPRDHLPVLVLLSLRGGWDRIISERTAGVLTRMAIALKQGSVERASFLKDVGPEFARPV